MRLVLRVIDGLCAAGALAAALGCAALAVMLIVEVIATSFFAWSQPWAVEYSGYLLAATLFAGTGWTLGRGGHIRVTVLTQMLPSAGLRVMDVATTVLAFAVATFAAWAMSENALRSYELGSASYYPSRTPLVWPQAVVAAGFWLLTLGLLARAARLIRDEPPEAPGESAGSVE